MAFEVKKGGLSKVGCNLLMTLEQQEIDNRYGKEGIEIGYERQRDGG